MDRETVKELMDTCYLGKRIRELMADLPSGMKPRHVHVIDVIYQMTKNGTPATVTDVSEELNVTMPSVTKLVHDLEALNVLEKHRDQLDKRNISLVLTPLGEKYYFFYVEEYLDWLGSVLDVVPMEDIETTIDTIKKIYSIMNHTKQNFPMEYNKR